MTRLILFAFLGLAALAGDVAAQPGARSVYILPMAGGLDQYLADQITRERVMQVVADPAFADTVMTDQINDAFAQRLAQLYPGKEEREKKDGGGEQIQHTFRSGAAKATVFLVDAKTRQVIWSSYEKPPRNRSVAQLNKEAGRIVKKLQTAWGKAAGK